MGSESNLSPGRDAFGFNLGHRIWKWFVLWSNVRERLGDGRDPRNDLDLGILHGVADLHALSLLTKNRKSGAWKTGG